MRFLRLSVFLPVVLATLAVAIAAPQAQAARRAPLQLTGENVAPFPGEFNALVEGKIGSSRTDLCFGFVVDQLRGSISRIAIHQGSGGFEGPEVVTLRPRAPGIMGRRGCVTVDRELARQIPRNKSQYYVVIKTILY